MRTLATYKSEGYKGPDASLAISLYDYGLIWKETETKGRYLCVYGVEPKGEGLHRLFSCDKLRPYTLALASWIDWEALRIYAGLDVLEAIKANDPAALYSLVACYGPESIFGVSYTQFTVPWGV